jgi:hypothetical protein
MKIIAPDHRPAEKGGAKILIISPGPDARLGVPDIPPFLRREMVR